MNTQTQSNSQAGTSGNGTATLSEKILQAETLVDTVLHGPTIERAAALFELTRQVSTGKSDFAYEAFNRIAYHTGEFESFVDRAISRGLNEAAADSVACPINVKHSQDRNDPPDVSIETIAEHMAHFPEWETALLTRRANFGERDPVDIKNRACSR